jgi:tetratricopeptide (TPR) repeat protein
MLPKSCFVFFLLTIVVVLSACSGVSRGPSAAQRAERMNAVKAEARLCVDEGRFERAVELLEPLSEEASGDSQVFVMLGEAYQGLGRNNDAIRSYESAIRLGYSDYLPHLKLANLLMEMGKTGRALTEYELAARHGDYDPVCRYDYGLALFQMGRRNRALEEWRAAYELDRGNPRYAEAVGIGLTGIDPRKAVGYFEEAVELGADGPAFFNNYAVALLRSGDPRAAGLQARKAVDLEPDNEEYRFNLAAAHMKSGAFREAVAEWDALIGRFGSRWSYAVYKGEALLERGQYDAAIQTLVPVVEAFEADRGPDILDRTPPDRGDAYEVLAMCHRSLEDRETALVYIEKALALEPDNPSFLNNYGVILAESGRIGEAVAQWKRVLEIDADNASARKNLSVVEP